MTTQTIPAAAALAALLDAQADDDLVHVVRACDPDLALCGAQVPGDDWDVNDDDTETCAGCLAVERSGDALHLASCITCRTAPAGWWLTH